MNLSFQLTLNAKGLKTTQKNIVVRERVLWPSLKKYTNLVETLFLLVFLAHVTDIHSFSNITHAQLAATVNAPTKLQKEKGLSIYLHKHPSTTKAILAFFFVPD